MRGDAVIPTYGFFGQYSIDLANCVSAKRRGKGICKYTLQATGKYFIIKNINQD